MSKEKLCPHGKVINKALREARKDFSLDEDYARQTQAFCSGQHDRIEEGYCMCCGQHYSKNLEQSNLSTGYCVECGWNP